MVILGCRLVGFCAALADHDDHAASPDDLMTLAACFCRFP
jgi:hypothetical protein